VRHAGFRIALKLVVRQGQVQEVPTDLVVVNLFEGVKKPAGATGAVDAASGGAIARALAAGDFKGKLKETLVLYPGEGAAKRILLIGLGDPAKTDLDKVRQVSARAAKRARELGVASFATVAHGAGIGGLPAKAVGQALAEGALLGLYRFDRYRGEGTKKKAEEERGRLAEVILVENDRRRLADLQEGVRVGAIIAESTNFTRDIAAVSGPDAHPEAIAKTVAAMAREVGLKCTVLAKKEIEKLGMGGLLGVNQGSAREPRFVVLEHEGSKSGAPFVAVGKGITFDTGGISIKPADKMDEMKSDKSGAAAVFGFLRACALLKIPQRVVGLAPLTDNMPSGSALKPGDVITAMNGKTMEIINTDAEGRLVLADALSYAARYDPAAVVDLATLTGGVVVALGNQTSGIMGNSEELMARLEASATRTRERVFRLPFYEEYDRLVDSKIADVKNSGGRPAHAIQGGKFLERFVDYPWVHVDIAGTAWDDGARPGYNEEYSPGPATGAGVRLLVDLAQNWKPMPKVKKST